MGTIDITYKQIITYLKENGFNVFDLDLASKELPIELIWNKEEDFKHFFKIAKEDGINTIIVEKFILKDEFLEVLDDYKSDFQQFIDKIGFYKFFWINNNVAYVLYESSEWFDDYIDLVSEISSEGINEYSSEGIPAEIKDISEEDLADELIEFASNERMISNGSIPYEAKMMFWESKELSRVELNPQIRFLKHKVEFLADKKLDEIQTEEEKNRLPDIIEECIEWCKEYNFKRITKSNLKAFLIEKNISLSKNGEDILYNKVNLELRLHSD